MTSKEQKQLKEKLIAGNTKAKMVGGIAVPRNIKDDRTKITRAQTSTKDKLRDSMRGMHKGKISDFEPESHFPREPSMPGFTSFSNKRKIKKAI